MPTTCATSVVERLRSVEQLMSDLDLASVDADELPRVTNALRRVESRCAAVGVAIAQRARSAGDDPNATLLGRGRVSGTTARKESRRADVADAMPAIGKALAGGDVSGEHVDAIAQARKGLDEAETARFDELGTDLAAAAGRLPVDTFKKKLRSLVDEQRSDHGMTRLQQQRARSELKMWTADDGMGHLHLTADPERFAKIQLDIERQAASMAASAKKSGEPVTMGPALQLDALVELLDQSAGALGRPTITVVVDQATLQSGPHPDSVCETTAGADLPVTVVERHACDAIIRPVVLDDAGLPINVGRSYRTATSAQWAALHSLYSTCVWKDCDLPITWCQAHHIHEWERGGRTDLDNLVPLCNRHHHAVHDDGWRLKLRPDRTLEIHRPNNTKPSSRFRSSPTNDNTPWATTRPDRQPHKPRPKPKTSSSTTSSSGSSSISEGGGLSSSRARASRAQLESAQLNDTTTRSAKPSGVRGMTAHAVG